MLLKHFDFTLPCPLRIFEMIITPELEYPMVCVGVRKTSDKRAFKLELIDLNSSSAWNPQSGDGVREQQRLDAVRIEQIERNAVVVCFGDRINIVDLDGRLLHDRRAQLHFDFPVESLVCLNDSALAFHAHGMQGRSYKTNEVTQEISDRTRTFRLLGSDSVVVLESRPTEKPMTQQSNIYILTGHENMLS